MTQQEALTILKGKDNVFLTGQPGAGKSYLTNVYIDWLIDNGKTFEVTASTGIAALNVGGKTLHSFAGLRNDEKLTEEDRHDILKNSKVWRRYDQTEVLIIDEISMVSAQLLENVDILAKIVRNNEKPFGGIKVIAVGDFYQLPPVKGQYCFLSPLWDKAQFTFCNISEQHRTNDATFIDVLQAIRTGVMTEPQKQVIRDRLIDDVSTLEGVTRLDTHNQKVDDINHMKLSRLTTPAKTYKMTVSGDEKYHESLKKHCLSPETLILKVGARVIFTRNDIEYRWVNGTQGEVTEVNEGEVKVRIYSNDEEVYVEKASWEQATGYGKNKKVLASIHQLPLRLAWAITIHKSQGMTLDRAVIDVSHVFATGQAYVAISRVRSLAGVYLQGKLTKGFLKIDEQVKDFYARNN
jgi:ATP-dependent DNA helicase PIF1